MLLVRSDISAGNSLSVQVSVSGCISTYEFAVSEII